MGGKIIVFRSEDDGALYPEYAVDVDPATGQAEGYSRNEVPDTFTLTAEQILGCYGDIGELLYRAEIMKKL